MMTRLNSMGLLGLNASFVEVEVDFLRSLPGFDIVGLPDAAVKESRDRVRYALKNSGFTFPNTRVTVNLAPADLKKTGPLYDLPIALAILEASGQIALPQQGEGDVFVGELSLNGEIRPVNGILPMVIHAREQGMRRFFVPEQNRAEAAIVEGIDVYPVEHLNQLLRVLDGTLEVSPAKPAAAVRELPQIQPDFQDVRGQEGAKRALEIAAAGGHHALLIGPPGSGKSMLAKRLPSILPSMSFDESIETTKIHSVAGLLCEEHPLVTVRPFRAPHHTISSAGLSGGGSTPRPGEISLAHNGVLFLDELPEFSRAAIEVLRQPMEDGRVTIARASSTLTYPCSMMVVAAMNPCPCGYYGHPTRRCTCSPTQVSRYLSRVSGPLLDRLDLHIDVQPVEFDQLTGKPQGEPSAVIRKRVEAARLRQQERFAGTGISSNATIPPAKLQQFCPMEEQAVALLRGAFERLNLSARAYDRIVKIARTIADLDGKEVLSAEHLAEAIQYRSLDRKYWQRNL